MKSLSIQDEHPRPDTTIEKLEKLKPIFEDGTVTAGNASGVNDGASALLLMSAEKAKELGLKTFSEICGRGNSGLRTDGYGTWSYLCIKKSIE